MSKILALTGVTGKKSGGVLAENIGNNIGTIKTLFPNGIRAVVRNTSDISSIENKIPAIEIFRGALTDVLFLKKCFEGVDTVLHLAGIHWSREIVEAAATCGVRRLILVHTTGIYSKYKEAGEEYRQIDAFVYETCKKHNIVLTICRPTMIYGNIYDNNIIQFIKMVDKLPIMPVVNEAKYELQPVHYRDLGNAYYNILINESETANRDFILSGGDPILLRDMLSEIGKNLGKNTKFINCPFSIAYTGAWVLYILTMRKIDYREKVQRLCEPRIFSHDDATKAFGYNPVTFKEGIVDEIIQYKAMKGIK